MLFQFLFQGLGVAEVAGGVAAFAHHQAADVGAVGFKIFIRDAVIADEGVGHHHDLLRIGRIGNDFLVADHRGVEDDLADFAAIGSETDSAEFLPGLEHQLLFRSNHIFVKLL